MMAHHHQLHSNQFSSEVLPWAQSSNFEPNQELFGVHAGMDMMLGLPNSKHHNNNNMINIMQRDLLDVSNNNHQTTLMRAWPIDGDISLQSSVDQSKESLVSRGALLQYQQQQQQMLMQDRRTMNSYQFSSQQQQQQPFQLRNSKFLSAAQLLLNEFCSLEEAIINSKKKVNKTKVEEGDQPSASSTSSLNLHSMDLLELQKIKAKLLSMLEEVDRRYRRYCDQMKSVVSTFEAVAGEGSATVYSALASKAMSRHFRCLKDGITVQIRTIRKMMGEKDPIAPGTTKGETPRLKMLDQCIRQQKAFQQGMMEQHPWRPQRGLPERSVSVLRAWLFEHFLHPYPNDVDKHILARQTGLSRSQVSNWFINARVRLWKPMVEEMYTEEMKELERQNNAQNQQEDNNENPNPNPSSNPTSSDLHVLDQKPLLFINDSDQSLSSIINTSHRHHDHVAASAKSSVHQQQQNFGPISNFDFLYSSHGSSCSNAGNVSLTLGLQQHGSMSFSSNSNHHSLLFSSDNQDDDGQPVQFSILDGESQTLPYRNLMGAQLLHDLTG